MPNPNIVSQKLVRGPAGSPGAIVERMLEGPDGQHHLVRINLAESPLMWLHARGHLDERLFLAGERLREDWENAGLAPRVTMRWDAAPVVRGPRGAPRPCDPHLARLSARSRFDGAMAAAGKGLADILWRVACAGEGLGAAEKALGWPSRAGKLVLGLALDRVAEYYRIA